MIAMSRNPRRGRRWIKPGVLGLLGWVVTGMCVQGDLDEFEVNMPGFVETVSDLRKDSGDLSVGAVLMDGFERYDARDFHEGDKVVLSNGDEFVIRDGYWRATGRRMEAQAAGEGSGPRDTATASNTVAAVEPPEEPDPKVETPQDQESDTATTEPADAGPSADPDDFLEGEIFVEKDGAEYRKQAGAWVRTGRNLKDPAVGGPAFHSDEPVLGELDRLPRPKSEEKSPVTHPAVEPPEPAAPQPELPPAPRAAEPPKTTVVDRLALPVLPTIRAPVLGEQDHVPSPTPEKTLPAPRVAFTPPKPAAPRPEPAPAEPVPELSAEEPSRAAFTDRLAQPVLPAATRPSTSAPPSTASAPQSRSFFMPPPSDEGGKISLELSCAVSKDGITWNIRGVAGHLVRGVLNGTDGYSATFEGIGTATHMRPLPDEGVVDTCVARDMDLGLMRTQRQRYGEGGQPLIRATPSGPQAP